MENNIIRRPILALGFVVFFPVIFLIWLFNNESMKDSLDNWMSMGDEEKEWGNRGYV